MSVFVWGSNKHKQLIGQTGLHCYAPAPAQNHFDDQVPTQVAAGDEHVLVLCESGDVYSYGEGKDGQLGQGTRFANKTASNKVQGLEHESVIHIAAGAHTSFAVSSTGSVYHWGLVHVGDARLDEAAAGQLTGLAQDDNTVIQPENDSRAARARVAARTGARLHQNSANNGGQTRYLRDIVRESTERWMLPTEDAEAEYYEELRAMGYHIDEVEEMVHSRDEDHLNMLRMVCRRQVQVLPTRIDSLERKHIVSISAGYAHVIALSEEGLLYAAGYNDRGQLGLGHRINTSVFKPVEFMKNKFVVQVSCGQQHNVCRAIDRQLSDDSVFVGSKAGADAYVWGNGILGQLGLGRRGTTKGRMLPSLVPSLHEKFPLGIVDVAAGANFTAVVTVTGEVYSFGHAEYNQHGTGNRSHVDYVDPYHFFEPRKVDISSLGGGGGAQQSSDSAVHIVSVNCGSVFTLATDTLGNLYSWGWNESGVLGHGFSHFSSSPQRVDQIGAHANGCKVAQASCGAKHVIALARHQGAPWASSYRQIQQDSRFFDCVVTLEGSGGGGGGGKGPALLSVTAPMRFPCHKAILSARSAYLKGFLRAAEGAPPLGKEETETPLEVVLSGAHYNAVTVRCLLDYLYLDRITVPMHKRKEVHDVARDLLLPGLHRAVMASASAWLSVPSSTFLRDATAMLEDRTYADVVFVARLDEVMRDEEERGSSSIYQEDHADGLWKLFCHRFIICRIPYFDALLSGSFVDSHQYLEWGGRRFLRIDATGLVEEGIDLSTLRDLIKFAYRGCCLRRCAEDKVKDDKEEEGRQGGRGGEKDEDEVDDEELTVNQAMALLVASNRVGFSPLAQICERHISRNLRRGTSEDLQVCMEFAQQFNLFRLERQCADLLRVTAKSHLEAGDHHIAQKMAATSVTGKR